MGFLVLEDEDGGPDHGSVSPSEIAGSAARGGGGGSEEEATGATRWSSGAPTTLFESE